MIFLHRTHQIRRSFSPSGRVGWWVGVLSANAIANQPLVLLSIRRRGHFLPRKRLAATQIFIELRQIEYFRERARAHAAPSKSCSFSLWVGRLIYKHVCIRDAETLCKWPCHFECAAPALCECVKATRNYQRQQKVLGFWNEKLNKFLTQPAAKIWPDVAVGCREESERDGWCWESASIFQEEQERESGMYVREECGCVLTSGFQQPGNLPPARRVTNSA